MYLDVFGDKHYPAKCTHQELRINGSFKTTSFNRSTKITVIIPHIYIKLIFYGSLKYK